MTSDVPVSWAEMRFDDFLSIQRGHDLPKSNRLPGDVPVIGASGRVGWHNESVVSGPSFTIGRAASIGNLVWEQRDFWPLNTTLYVTDAHGNDLRFAYYLLHTVDFQQYNSGSVQPMLNRNFVAGHRLVVPPVEEQRAIAEVLGALDDRIEWCHRLAGDLLELSRAAFLESTAASPERDVSIYDVATVEYGAPYKSVLFNDDRRGLPVIRIRDVGSEDTAAYTTERHTRDVVIEPGDIIVGMDGEFRAHPWRGPTALLNQRVCTFRPKPGVARALVLHALEEPLRFYESSITGTTVIHLGKKHIDRFRVPYSETGNELLRDVADPMLDHIVHLSQEKRSLQRLRDTLLPQLVSGELRIEDPSRLLESVA